MASTVPPAPEAPVAPTAPDASAMPLAIPVAEAPAEPTNLDEAVAYARARLAREVGPAFRAGLPAGEVVAVKVPFRTRAGTHEYMWVELTEWDGSLLTGRLANDPRDVPGMRKGDVVRVNEAEIWDYVWKRADGTREGGWTKAFVR